MIQLSNHVTDLSARYKLFIILIIAGILRFYNLADKGFILWDEAQYAKYTQFGYSVLQNIDFVIESVNNNNISDSPAVHSASIISPAITDTGNNKKTKEKLTTYLIIFFISLSP